ncbi:MAG: serine/threonine-protein kinase [Phycisphaerales bacterium]
MNADQLRRVEAAYFKVRELPPDQRAAAIADACDGDAALTGEVESLLRHDEGDTFLSRPAVVTGLLSRLADGPPDAPGGPADALLGATVGPWRIERLLGTGGMGAVYLGIRADGAFEGRAAIKVVKRGMDTDDLLRRFRQERRTLANLRHPNIAALHDAGSLPDGRPYLVMEFVDGRPITHFCRERRLTTVERLGLFVDVCRAVQFAHQNLVIHRDLKPANILVTREGTPKLLDFGIAKVLHTGGTPAVTQLDERRLTPEYASPEQVQGHQVTTATDIYSLGVILYELLAGAPPYTFQTRTNAEAQRIVGSVEPPPPSQTAAAAEGTGRADTTPARLRRELRGDLDTIALMAIRKEPQRRYSSAEQLVADIQRHLSGLPVIARRDTLAYRTSKFVIRHRWALAAAVLALAGIIAGIAAIDRQRDQAFVARDQAEAIAKFMHDTLASADPLRGRPELTVRELLDRAAARITTELGDQPKVRAAVRSSIGRSYLGLGLIDEGDAHIRAAYEERMLIYGAGHHDTAESMLDLASVLAARGRHAEAEPLVRGALADFQRLRGSRNIDVARARTSLGTILKASGKPEEAAAELREAIRLYERALVPDENGAVLQSRLALADALLQLGRPAEARPVIEAALRADPPPPDGALRDELHRTAAAACEQLGDAAAAERHRAQVGPAGRDGR